MKLHQDAGVEVITSTSVEGLSENNENIEVFTSNGKNILGLCNSWYWCFTK